MHKYLISLMEYFSARNPINFLEIGHEVCDMHYHIMRKVSPIYALEYIVSGSNKYTINNTDFVAYSGDVVLLPKNTTHDYRVQGEVCEKIWFVFDGAFVEQMIDSYLDNNTYKFNCPAVQDYFLSILDLAKNNYSNPNCLFGELSVKLFCVLIHLRQSSSLVSTTSIEEKMMKYIDDNITKPFSLSKMSNQFGYSKNRLIVLFKTKFSITPNCYYINKRIAIACLYLKNTSYTIKFISDNLGYADQHYFTNSFTSIMSMTPTKYREQVATIN